MSTAAWDSIAEDYRAFLQGAGILKTEFNTLSISDRLSYYECFQNHNLSHTKRSKLSSDTSGSKEKEHEGNKLATNFTIWFHSDVCGLSTTEVPSLEITILSFVEENSGLTNATVYTDDAFQQPCNPEKKVIDYTGIVEVGGTAGTHENPMFYLQSQPSILESAFIDNDEDYMDLSSRASDGSDGSFELDDDFVDSSQASDGSNGSFEFGDDSVEEVTADVPTVAYCYDIPSEMTSRPSNAILKEGEIVYSERLNEIFKMNDKFPKWTHFRKETCDVFHELIRPGGEQRKIFVGTPGVGRKILLFLVALYRKECDGTPGCFISETRKSEEVFNVQFVDKVKINCFAHFCLLSSGDISRDVEIEEARRQATKVDTSIEKNEPLLYIDFPQSDLGDCSQLYVGDVMYLHRLFQEGPESTLEHIPMISSESLDEVFFASTHDLEVGRFDTVLVTYRQKDHTVILWGIKFKPNFEMVYEEETWMEKGTHVRRIFVASSDLYVLLKRHWSAAKRLNGFIDLMNCSGVDEMKTFGSKTFWVDKIKEFRWQTRLTEGI